MTALALDKTSPQVSLDTSEGQITLTLYPDAAPKSVSNFLQYVRDGHYDNTIFHRVIPGFMIQGGGFDRDMHQKPTREPITNEASPAHSNLRGTLAMARTYDPHSATAQFFINLKNNPHLDAGKMGAGYAVFGHVTVGMEVVDQIAKRSTGAKGLMKDVPEQDILIKSARILTNDVTEQNP